jgi:hypothetical protein
MFAVRFSIFAINYPLRRALVPRPLCYIKHTIAIARLSFLQGLRAGDNLMLTTQRAIHANLFRHSTL